MVREKISSLMRGPSLAGGGALPAAKRLGTMTLSFVRPARTPSCFARIWPGLAKRCHDSWAGWMSSVAAIRGGPLRMRRIGPKPRFRKPYSATSLRDSASSLMPFHESFERQWRPVSLPERRRTATLPSAALALADDEHVGDLLQLGRRGSSSACARTTSRRRRAGPACRSRRACRTAPGGPSRQ